MSVLTSPGYYSPPPRVNLCTHSVCPYTPRYTGCSRYTTAVPLRMVPGGTHKYQWTYSVASGTGGTTGYVVIVDSFYFLLLSLCKYIFCMENLADVSEPQFPPNEKKITKFIFPINLLIFLPIWQNLPRF